MTAGGCGGKIRRIGVESIHSRSERHCRQPPRSGGRHAGAVNGTRSARSCPMLDRVGGVGDPRLSAVPGGERSECCSRVGTTYVHRERYRSERIGWLRAAVLGANDGIVSTDVIAPGREPVSTARAESAANATRRPVPKRRHRKPHGQRGRVLVTCT